MAVLSDTQQAILEQLSVAKEVYDEFLEDQKRRIADEKWEMQADMRRLIREAREHGVPYRQIGFCVGTSDHNTIKDMEKNKRREK